MLKDFITGVKFGAVAGVIPAIVIYAAGAQAMSNNYANNGNNSSTANDGTGNACANNNAYPAPYTGGAGVARYFHLSDGSTITITTTGAVIKQSPCHSAYREGWINVADICNINSAHDLNGRISAGQTNPNGSGSYAGCTSTAASPTGQQRGMVTIVNNNSQSQSQSQAQGGSGGGAPVAAASAQASTAKTSAQAQAQVPIAQTATSSAAKTLPNTGPGNVMAIAGSLSVVSGLGHYLYQITLKKRLL